MLSVAWRHGWHLQLGAVSLFRKVSTEAAEKPFSTAQAFQQSLQTIYFLWCSESHVRQCGLWPGGVGETFSWVLFPRFARPQSTSQCCFALQSLHKPLPSTTSASYYKASAKSSSHFFALQSLHKVFSSTTSYYKACTKYVPEILRTTRWICQRVSQVCYISRTEYNTVWYNIIQYII